MENKNISNTKKSDDMDVKKDEDNNIDNELKEIIERNPLEELKLIREKIRIENDKINEIDSKLDKIRKDKKIIKRTFDVNNDLSNSTSNDTKKSNILINIQSHKIIPILTEKNIKTSNSIDFPHLPSSTYNLILQKMKDIKSFEIINSKSEQKDGKLKQLTKKDNNLQEFKNNINLEMNRLLEMEREEKKKINEDKNKLSHDKVLEKEKQRKKIIEQKCNISMNPKNKIVQKKYYYLSAMEKEELRKEKEEQLLKIEKEKRKQKYLPISSEELNQFSKEVSKNRKILSTELTQKKKQMKEIWKERKNLLPKFHSKFMDLNIEYDKEAKEELILRQEKLKNKEIERMNFGKEIVKNFLPKKLNDKLKTEREQRINELKGKNRLNNIKELENKFKEKSKKLVQSQPKKFNKKNIFIAEPSIKELQSKKLTGKAIDYLLEQRNKNNKLNYAQLIQSNSAKKMKEWNKMLETEGNNVVNNLAKIKLEANLMNNKANNINQIIKLESNNLKKNEELKTEASHYYINSIQAKLQVLNKIMSSES